MCNVSTVLLVMFNWITFVNRSFFLKYLYQNGESARPLQNGCRGGEQPSRADSCHTDEFRNWGIEEFILFLNAPIPKF